MTRLGWAKCCVATILALGGTGCGGGGGEEEEVVVVGGGGGGGGGSGNTAGSLVVSFGNVGTGGVLIINPSTGADAITEIAIDSASLYLVGADVSPGNEQWRIEKRDINIGTSVTSFGTGGIVTTNPGSGDDRPTGIAIDSASMYVVGIDTALGATNQQARIEKRSLSTGTLVSAFGAGGVITVNLTGGSEFWNDIAIDGSSLYVVGVDAVSTLQWRIEKRNLTTGALDGTFGTGGVVNSNPSGSGLIDEAIEIAIDSTNMYVVGTDSVPGNLEWRIEKRSLSSGALVGSFGTSGVVTVNPSANQDEPFGVAVDASALYVVGYEGNPSETNRQWRIEKRDITTGALVTSFGTGGVVTNNITSGGDHAETVLADATGLYIIGMGGLSQWRVEKRTTGFGSLVTTFGTGGVATSSLATAECFAGAVNSAHLFMAGYDSAPGNGQWRVEKRLK